MDSLSTVTGEKVGCMITDAERLGHLMGQGLWKFSSDDFCFLSDKSKMVS